MVEKQLAKRSSSALFNFFLPSCEIVISGWKNFLAFLAWRPWHCRFFSTKKLFARIFYTLLLLFLCWSAPVFIVSFIHSFLLTCNWLSIKRHSVILGGKFKSQFQVTQIIEYMHYYQTENLEIDIFMSSNWYLNILDRLLSKLSSIHTQMRTV